MTKHPLLSALSISALLLSTNACSSNSNSEPKEVRSDKAFRPQRDNLPGNEVTEFWESQTRAALALRAAGGELEANYAFSPASLSIALAMTSTGGNESVLESFETALQFPTQSKLHDIMATTLGSLQQLNHDAVGTVGQQGGIDAQRVELANSLWPHSEFTFLPAFLDTLSESYNVGLYPVDYLDFEGARASINEWVSERTQNKIPELIPPKIINSETRLTLVNAIYLKAPWKTSFASEAKLPFTSVDGSGIQTSDIDYLIDGVVANEGALTSGAERAEVYEIAYGHDDLSFVVIVPQPGIVGPPSQIPTISDDTLVAALQLPLSPSYKNINLPKFTIRSSTKLKPALSEIGLAQVFEGGFSNITPDYSMRIAEVVHEAFIAIDKDGTEAAAATAVVMQPDSAPPSVTVDHSFWFVIRDNTFHVPLCIGYVAKP